MPNFPIRVVICGLGRAGRIHVVNLLQNSKARIVAISEIPAAHATALSFLNEIGLKDADKLLCSPDKIEDIVKNDVVDALIIATPTFEHKHLIEIGLMARKSVFCEKPLAPTIEETADLYKLADEKNCVLFCSLNRRFDPSLLELRKTLLSGSMGRTLVMKTVARDHPVPTASFLSSSGGMIHDCAIHDIDCVCWLAQSYPDEVFVMAYCYDEEIAKLGDVDTAAITLKFTKPYDFMATIDLCRHGNYGYDQRVEVFCVNGVLEMLHQRKSSIARTDIDGTCFAPIKHSFPQRYEESYKLLMDYFLEISKKQEKASLVKGEDVVKATLVADAAFQAMKTGKVVKIDYENLSFQ